MKKKRIIIVEDERIIAEDIKSTLLTYNYDVLEIFSRGEEAISKVVGLKPDLVLMDIMLAGEINGIQTTKKINELIDVPIIYLTAFANENILEDAKITQPYGYLIKPFQERELYATIEMAFYRYQLEQEIKNNEKKYRVLFNSIADPIFIFGKNDHHFLDCNNAVLQIYGYSKDELLKMTPFDLHSENDYEIVSQNINSISDKPYNYHHYKKNGEILIVSILTNEIIYDGKPAWISIVHDITEQIKADETLRKTQLRLSTVFHNVPNIILYETGEDKQFISENVNELLGYSVDDLINNKQVFLDLIHEDDKKIVFQKIKLWESNFSEEMLTLWYRVRTAFGYYIWIEDRMVQITLENGRKYITGVLIDNTDLKNVEKALRKSQTQYKAVVEDQTEFINRFNRAGKITFINNAYSHFAGKANNQLLGSDWTDVVPKEDVQIINELLEDLTIERPVTTHEFCKNLKDGNKLCTEWTFRAIYNEDGEFMEYQSVGKDITERKNAEAEKEKIREQLYQSQKMEVVGKLAGGIAHDFNNLLTAINGYADIALKKLPSKDKVIDDIKVIKDCGLKAAKLTQQLLGFSRKQIVERKIINLNLIISELLKMLNRLIGKNFKLELQLSENPSLVLADAGQIEQVLVNLVVNARDAMPEGGSIKICTTKENISETDMIPHQFENPGEYVIISVTDTGTGMTEEVKSQIFEPFFTTKEIGKGTGLGLATVFGIIKQNNGNIEVETEIGQGTTFNIYLPAVTEEEIIETKSKAVSEVENPKGEETILLVEDEEAIREFVFSILEESGYNVLEASSGVEGLKISEDFAGTIHLLLSDIRMPEMSGPELARKLKQKHPETKLLFVSGHTDNDAIRKEIGDTPCGFLHKPFSYDALLSKVRTELDQKK